ncbi:hypothetical protein M119_4911 [Bacteroides fragilis str. 3783N1-6]|uniref:Uncharacterized protein n=1 Tax=Bacteroides fragilis str. 3783N1-6 TaxID=1339310 RepID=A0AB73ATK0_BACFG|nr:hypothetical protein M119_4911 [Bacteroides fragilis str. 3783N1-6]
MPYYRHCYAAWHIRANTYGQNAAISITPVLQGDARLNSRVLQVLAENGFDSRTPTLPI